MSKYLEVNNEKKKLVISGINVYTAGVLSIYKDCLRELINLHYNQQFEIIAFVYKEKLFEEFKNDVTIFELPNSRKSWIHRIYYEYIYFKNYSKKTEIEIWFSIHDMTPNVLSKKRYVYCHNATPFYKPKLKEIKYTNIRFMWYFFYKYIYKINIKKNDFVIVQQDWIRNNFKNMYNLKNVIVAHPDMKKEIINLEDGKYKNNSFGHYNFIYPSYPRNFKNIELICEAASNAIKNNYKNFSIVLTLDGSENQYAKELVKRYAHIEQLKFVGVLQREELFKYYQRTDCLLFSSKLETWGLPISEFKVFQKPMILIDLPYTHETLGKYEKVNFFSELEDLTKYMIKELINAKDYQGNEEVEVIQPYAENWEKLFEIIFG